MIKLIKLELFNTLKRIFFVAIIIFLSTFLLNSWAMEAFLGSLSSACLYSGLFDTAFKKSLRRSFFITILFQVLFFFKKKYIKIPIEFLLLASVLMFWYYTIFVERKSLCSTYLFSEQMHYTFLLSFTAILVLTFSILIHLKLSLKKKEFRITKLFLFLTLIFALESCARSSQKENTIETILSDSLYKKPSMEIKKESDKNNSEEPEIVFPKTGNKVTDFLPSSDIYEIQYEAKGDLNNDGLVDIVIVLVHQELKTADRPMLILLQNKDKSYSLDKVSFFAMPIEYTDNDYKIYDTEDVIIENGILKIQLYGIGPSGNVFSDFKYFGNDLILIYVETYNTGAGSWQQLFYNLENGELRQVITNTMEESMPSKEKTFTLSKEKYKFESVSPNDVIIKAYKKVESER